MLAKLWVYAKLFWLMAAMFFSHAHRLLADEQKLCFKLSNAMY